MLYHLKDVGISTAIPLAKKDCYFQEIVSLFQDPERLKIVTASMGSEMKKIWKIIKPYVMIAYQAAKQEMPP